MFPYHSQSAYGPGDPAPKSRGLPRHVAHRELRRGAAGVASVVRPRRVTLKSIARKRFASRASSARRLSTAATSASPGGDGSAGQLGRDINAGPRRHPPRSRTRWRSHGARTRDEKESGAAIGGLSRRAVCETSRRDRPDSCHQQRPRHMTLAAARAVPQRRTRG